MIALAVLAAVAFGRYPPDPHRAITAALRLRDYRLAGVSSFWGNFAAQRTDNRPYGLRCAALPANAWAYTYVVSDAVASEALEGYRRQKRFLLTYNRAMLASGKLPAAWHCFEDRHPGRLG